MEVDSTVARGADERRADLLAERNDQKQVGLDGPDAPDGAPGVDVFGLEEADALLGGEAFHLAGMDGLPATGRPVGLRDGQDDLLAALDEGAKRGQSEGARTRKDDSHEEDSNAGSTT